MRIEIHITMNLLMCHIHLTLNLSHNPIAYHVLNAIQVVVVLFVKKYPALECSICKYCSPVANPSPQFIPPQASVYLHIISVGNETKCPARVQSRRSLADPHGGLMAAERPECVRTRSRPQTGGRWRGNCHGDASARWTATCQLHVAVCFRWPGVNRRMTTPRGNKHLTPKRYWCLYGQSISAFYVNQPPGLLTINSDVCCRTKPTIANGMQLPGARELALLQNKWTYFSRIQLVFILLII